MGGEGGGGRDQGLGLALCCRALISGPLLGLSSILTRRFVLAHEKVYSCIADGSLM